jgi:cytochrome c-type biogenesis protein CcmF
MSGEAISVGPPYFNLTFTPLMAALLVLLPIGPLLAWKRGDAAVALKRLGVAVLTAVAIVLLMGMLVAPRNTWGVLGVALGGWLIAGALVEIGERSQAFRVPAAETWRRLTGLPRGAWGMTLAHLGLGVFVLGAVFETAWKVEAAEALPIGGAIDVGGYHVRLAAVDGVSGPNYDADRGTIAVTRAGQPVCHVTPERRLYTAGGQTTSEVGLCYRGLSHLYIVLGERREGGTYLVRAYWNPWASLIFAGPVIMGLGGLVSLSDRRLRLAAGRRRREQEA